MYALYVKIGYCPILCAEKYINLFIVENFISRFYSLKVSLYCFTAVLLGLILHRYTPITSFLFFERGIHPLLKLPVTVGTSDNSCVT